MPSIIGKAPSYAPVQAVASVDRDPTAVTHPVKGLQDKVAAAAPHFAGKRPAWSDGGFSVEMGDDNDELDKEFKRSGTA